MSKIKTKNSKVKERVIVEAEGNSLVSESKGSGSKYQVPNLERALKMIELLAEHPAGLGISEMSSRLGIPKNSAFRIAMTLFSFQYLDRDAGSKNFSLSGKLLGLGYAAVNEQNLVEKSLDIMRELRDQVRETVLIGLILGQEGIVLEQIPGSYPLKFLVDPGAHFPLHTAAPGKAILAFMPEVSRNNIVNSIKFKPFNDKTILSKVEFHEVLRRVKLTGYSIDWGEEIEGIHCVAAPIFDRHGFPTAAIWTTGPAERMPQTNIEEIGKLLMEYALKISKRLGYFVSEKKSKEHTAI